MHINRGVNSKKNIFSLEEKSIDNLNLLAYEQVLIISPTTGAFLKNEKVDESSEFEATNNNSKRKPNY